MNKIVYTEGCTCYSVTVNEELFLDLEEETQRSILHKLVDKVDKEDLQSVVITLLETVGEYEWLYHCDQCGDDVCTYTIEY